MHAMVLAQYDRVIGLELGDVTGNDCITKAPGGGAYAGHSPLDRGKPGIKSSVLVDGTGVPLAVVATGANRHDSPLLAEALTRLDTWGGDPDDTTVHLDRGYDSAMTRVVFDELVFDGEIARKRVPDPNRETGVGRAHACVDERVRRVAALHREAQGGSRTRPRAGGGASGHTLT